MIGYMIILAYITHVVGCLWYAVGFQEEVINGHRIVGWIERVGLIRVDRPVVGIDEFGEDMLGDGAWDQREELVPIGRHVLTAFYWSITTLTTVTTCAAQLRLRALECCWTLSELARCC